MLIISVFVYCSLLRWTKYHYFDFLCVYHVNHVHYLSFTHICSLVALCCCVEAVCCWCVYVGGMAVSMSRLARSGPSLRLKPPPQPSLSTLETGRPKLEGILFSKTEECNSHKLMSTLINLLKYNSFIFTYTLPNKPKIYIFLHSDCHFILINFCDLCFFFFCNLSI